MVKRVTRRDFMNGVALGAGVGVVAPASLWAQDLERNLKLVQNLAPITIRPPSQAFVGVTKGLTRLHMLSLGEAKNPLIT